MVALGGTVRRDELTCVGPVAAATLGRFRFDLAVIGAAGLSARWGLTELDDGEAEIQRLAIERAARVVVIADGSKIGATTNAIVTQADSIETLVTDESASTVELARLAATGLDVIIAGLNDDSPGAMSGRVE